MLFFLYIYDPKTFWKYKYTYLGTKEDINSNAKQSKAKKWYWFTT